MLFTRVVSALVLVAVVACEDEANDPPRDAGGMDAATDDSGGDDAAVNDAGIDSAHAHDSAIDDNDAGMCAAPVVAAECEGNSEGWFAIKTTFDVWWQSTRLQDPGRDHVEVYALAQLNDDCDDAGNHGDLKLCGLTLPTITSDVICDAVALQVPDAMWESPLLPRFKIARAASVFQPDAIETFDRLTALHGIDLIDGHEGEPWPTSTRASDITCEAGSGSACFPDHDGDGFPGVTLRLRTDGASNLPRAQRTTYVGPYGDGNCANGLAYKYQALPASDCDCTGGPGLPVYAQEIHMGIGIGLGGDATLSAACTSASGSLGAPFIGARVVGCKVDATSQRPSDPRLATGDLTCTADEVSFLQEYTPVFRVLRAGEIPGESLPLLGWQLTDRDIDKRVSGGAKVSIVRLADLDDTEPTCATVRAAAYPTP